MTSIWQMNKNNHQYELSVDGNQFKIWEDNKLILTYIDSKKVWFNFEKQIRIEWPSFADIINEFTNLRSDTT